MLRSMFAPIEVKANKQLYCRMFFINFVDRGPPLNAAKVAKGSGRERNGGILILPLLQHELYMTRFSLRDESHFTLSWYQNIA